MIAVFAFLCLFANMSSAEPENARREVIQRLQNFAKELNQGNPETLSSYWTQDAEFTKPTTGELVEGKEEINQVLKKMAQEIKEKHLLFTFKEGRIDFPDPDDAVVEGVVEITNNGALVQRTARRIGMVKDNGQWYIDTVDEIEVQPAPPLYKHLKDLEWLVGNWKDQDENVTITFKTFWSNFHNFITQNFKMVVYGLEAMEGIQMIGWDPIEKKIRSWIFDSDGGFGTGVWTKNGDSWSVALNYIMSDGKKGSATDIYTKINSNSYQFSSTGRTINGQALPNIEPVTVVKEE